MKLLTRSAKTFLLAILAVTLVACSPPAADETTAESAISTEPPTTPTERSERTAVWLDRTGFRAQR